MPGVVLTAICDTDPARTRKPAQTLGCRAFTDSRALTGVVGSIQAVETLKVLMGIGQPLVSRLLLIDALNMEFRTVKLRRNPECPLCGAKPTVKELIDYEVFCGLKPPTPAAAHS
jgi:hypothetical protein